MTLYRTVEPAAEPVTLADVKAYLRLDHNGEDALLSGLIHAAREEGERSTGLALIAQSWRLALDCWPKEGVALLFRHPVIEVLSVTVFGPDGEGALLDPETYQVDAISRPARIAFASLTEPGRAMNGIEIDFTAGFGEAGTDVPDTLKRAIVLLVAHWFEFRAAFSAEDQPVVYPAGYERLIAGSRGRRL